MIAKNKRHSFFIGVLLLIFLGVLIFSIYWKQSLNFSPMGYIYKIDLMYVALSNEYSLKDLVSKKSEGASVLYQSHQNHQFDKMILPFSIFYMNKFNSIKISNSQFRGSSFYLNKFINTRFEKVDLRESIFYLNEGKPCYKSSSLKNSVTLFEIDSKVNCE